MIRTIASRHAVSAAPLLALLLSPLLTSCKTESSGTASSSSSSVGLSFGSGFSGSLTGSPQVINVSHYDPKERQRSGSSYTENDVSALKRNGARGLIARCGKGHTTDEKCAAFLKAAEREGMLIGSYYFILYGVDPMWQADRFIERIQSIKRSQGLRSPGILMVVDFDSKTSVSTMIRVIDRVQKRTGKPPVVYLENSLALMDRMRAATPAQKSRLRQCPYWMALYSHTHEDRETPSAMLNMYGVWNHTVMWQYGGVKWDSRRGRSIPQNYNHGRWRSPTYFGNMDRPMERNAFNGSQAQLAAFWNRYAWMW